MNPQGWVKLHRAVQEHPRFLNPKWLYVWLYLQFNAAHRPHKAVFGRKVISIRPGQLIANPESIASALKGLKGVRLNESAIERVLMRLKTELQITWEASNKARLITIVNWPTEQGDGKRQGEKSNSKRTPNELQTNSKRTATRWCARMIIM